MTNISYWNMALGLIPALVVVFILARWSLQAGNAAYALARMLGQLLLVGYALTFIFKTDKGLVIIGVLSIMVAVSSWIALRTIKDRRRQLFRHALVSILIGGGAVLAVVTQLVLEVEPWFLPKFVVPLAGMVFSNAMNSVSLAAERFYSETDQGTEYLAARNHAFQASLIPITNSLFAVGLVAIPGMMTGQILSGVSPLIAVRYQIVVMCMVFASAGLSSAMFLVFLKKQAVAKQQ